MATPTPPVKSGLVETYRSALAAADRLNTPDGELVIVLAERLVKPDSGTASALATLARELRATFEAAMKNVDESADVVDGIFKTA